jgi:5-methylcytosine-specific restriction endonuclease McrA
MGVMWVWNLKTPEMGNINAAAGDWREASRRNVDEVIGRIRSMRRKRIAFKETACPECSYITRNVFFPAQCIYCGGSLQSL